MRHHLPAGLAVVLACAFMLASAAGAAGPTAPTFQAVACPEGVFPAELDVDCGYITVPQNRANPTGPTATVAAAVVHASEPAEPDPIVFLDGGPSFGAISPFAMTDYFADATYVRNRDVILVDTRGTGLSTPYLGCPEIDAAFYEVDFGGPVLGHNFGPLLDQAVADCRSRLVSDGVDLSGFTSAETAADLEALRQALGYAQWNLWAISADGVAGLTYMRLYPDSIRSAVLDSPQSPHMSIGLDYLRGRFEMLERTFAGCAANAACDVKYPNLRTRFYNTVARLQAEPVLVKNRLAGRAQTIRVDGIQFLYDALFGVDPGAIQSNFKFIWDVSSGRVKRVYDKFLGAHPHDPFRPGPKFPPPYDTNDFLADGKTLSYLCHDIIGFLTQDEFDAAAADHPAAAPEILSLYFDHPFGTQGVLDLGQRSGRAGAARARLERHPDARDRRRIRPGRARIDHAGDSRDARKLVLLRVPGDLPSPARELQPGRGVCARDRRRLSRLPHRRARRRLRR